MLDDSRYRVGARFSSSKCPPGAGMSCELPFGFLWTPMAPASSVPTAITDETTQSAVISNQLPPGVICVTCLAYMNLYCKVDDKSGRWTCALCQSENVTTVETVVNHGRNLLVSPRIEFRQALTIPIIATEKNADVTPSSSSREQPKLQSTIVVVLDQNLPSQEAQAVGNMMKSLLEKETKENHRQINNLGLIIFGKSVSIYQLGISSSGMAVADTFRSHEGFTVDRLKERSYLGTSVETLLTCISAQFGISAKHATGSDGKETHAEPIKSRMEILKERKQARLQKEEQRQKSADANDVLHDDSSSSGVLPRSPWTVARERSATSKPPFRCTGEAIQCAIDLASMADLSSSSAESSSRVARAASRNDRILLFTNGCPNLGNGSVVDINDGDIGKGGVAAYSTVDPGKLARASEYYDLIAKAAAESGIGMDVFCTGSAELGLPAYQSLVEPSSGYVLSHDSFTTPHLEHNVGFIVQQTHISMAQFFEESQDDKFVASPEQHLLSHHGTWVDGCMVDIRMSSFLSPTHLIGPGDLIESPDGPLVNEQAAFEKGVQMAEQELEYQNGKIVPSIDMLESTLTRIRLGRYDPLSTFSVMLSLNEFFQHDEYAFFQCTVRYFDRDCQALVTRVMTHRLSVASDVGEFLEAIDEEVVPVLLGKEAVYRSMFGRDVDTDHPFHAPHAGQLDNLAYDAQRDLDNTVFRISGAFRLLSLEQGTRTIDLTEEGGIKAAGSSMDFAFPPELSDALRRLYHLRRGPFLSPGPLQSMDDRAEMRSLFVRFPLEDCLSMMAPALWSSGSLDEALARNSLSVDDVPPETLALWENRIIAADHSHNLFVWSGSATLATAYDGIREQLKKFLLDRSHKRFPMPNLYALTEADSMSRRFIALLAPSHGDPVEHQLAHFQALALLSTEEQMKLQSRFRFHDPESDPSFRKWFWEVASAASTSGSEGISLCE